MGPRSRPTQIFVSSTALDLRPERTSVAEALLRMHYIRPIVMERFGARDEPPRTVSLEELDECQLYIGILGGRYGSGITHAEYCRALELGLECLVYLKDEAAIPPEGRDADLERVRALEEFKREVKARHTVQIFRSPDELAVLLTADVHNWLLRSRGLQGKVRAYLARIEEDPEFADWRQQEYFELQLGNRRDDYDIRMRLRPVFKGAEAPPGEKYTVGKAVRCFRRLFILGEPGSGKTTALRRLALDFAEDLAETLDIGSAEPWPPLPVYVWLPRFNTVEGDTPYDRFCSLLRDAFHRTGVPLEPEELEELLGRYQWALLLDGLNEVGHDRLALLRDAQTAFERIYPSNLVVLASRPHNVPFWTYDLPVLELLELRYPEDIQEYLEAYLEDPVSIERLMAILRGNLQVRQLAVNPLLLFLIVMVFKKEGGWLPRSRARLLDRIARGLLGAWSRETASRHHQREWGERKWLLLTHLGYAMKAEGLELTDRRTAEIFAAAAVGWPERPDWDQLIEELRSDRILLQTRNREVVRFWHQTMQEYFAACRIAAEIGSALAATAGRGWDWNGFWALRRKLRFYVDDPRWHETLALAGGLLPAEGSGGERAMASRLVKEVWRRDRLLASMCVSNAESFGDEAMLAQYAGKLRRQVVTWGLMVPKVYPWSLLAAILITTLLVPTAALDSALDLARSTLHLPLLAARLVDTTLALAAGTVAVLMFFRLAATGLLRLETHTNERFIRPAITALRHLRNDDAQRLLQELSVRIANDFSVGDETRATIYAGLVMPVRDEPELILMLASSRTRLQAMERLADLGSEGAVGPLLELLRTQALDDVAYTAAVRSLTRIGRLLPGGSSVRRAIEGELWHILASNEPFMRQLRAAGGLMDLGFPEARPPARGALMRLLGRHWRLVAVVLAVIVILLLASGRLGLNDLWRMTWK